MVCKNCKRQIDDDSIFCKWCGEKQIRERRKKAEVKVPKPRQLKSGEFIGQIMIDGTRHTVKGATVAEYEAKCKAYKAGIVEVKRGAAGVTVGELVDSYLIKNSNVLSPSTIKGYRTIRRNAFPAVMGKDALKVDWQNAINAEAERVSPKSVINNWRLITASLKSAGVAVPEVNLPKVARSDRPWLDYEQIQTFLDAVAGEPCELGALLALHSLRRSEILGLNVADIHNGIISVRGAAVVDDAGELVYKQTNKNDSSARDIPVMIPRLVELLPESGPVLTTHHNTLRKQINRVCDKAGLPLVGVHGLRHSFASLAFHLGWPEMQTMAVGGWSNYDTVHKIYTHLAAKDSNAAVQKMTDFYANYD